MKKIRLLIETIAFGGAASGSMLLALNLGLNPLAYALFLSSSIASVYLLRTTPDAPKSLIYQNVFFIVVNLTGLIRYS